MKKINALCLRKNDPCLDRVRRHKQVLSIHKVVLPTAVLAIFVFSGLLSGHSLRASLWSSGRAAGQQPQLGSNTFDGRSPLGGSGISRKPFAPLAPSDPDSTFGGTGKVSLNLPGNSNEYAESVVLQPDGKVVVGGTDSDFRIVRYNADGNLDSTFGVNGVATIDFGTTESFYDMEIQGDGKIVAVGAYNIGGADRHFAVARLNTDGTLDPSFDGDGKLTYNALPGGNDYAVGVAIQADQKIVVSGLYEPSSIDTIVIRLNTNGTLDTGFDGDGVKVYSISGGADYGNDVAIQPADQKIVVGGVASNGSNVDFAVSRLNTDGTLDTSFDTDGLTTAGITTSDDVLLKLALQSDGKIIGAGRGLASGSNNDFTMIRLNTNGSLDTTFNGTGKVQTDFGAGRDDVGRRVAIQADDKIIMVGETNTVNGVRYDFGIARYNTNGSLDTTFDTDGKLTAQFNANNSISTDIVVQPDTKFLVVGRSNWATVDFGVMRFNPNGSFDVSWGSGKVSLDFAAGNEDGRSVARQSDGKLVVLGRYLIGGNFAIGLSRYDANGNLDTTFDGDGKVTTQINSTYPQAVAIQTDGKIVVAGFYFTGAGYDFLLLRYNSNGSLDTSFDGDGIAGLNITTNDLLHDVAIQSDGKIVVVGELLNGATDDYVVLLYRLWRYCQDWAKRSKRFRARYCPMAKCLRRQFSET